MNDSFFVVPSETLLDKITDSIERRPEFQDRLAAIHEQKTDALVPPGDSWMRIASIAVQLKDVAKLLQPGFFTDKKQLYAWLDKHPRWCTYDRRKHAISSRYFRFDGMDG